MKRLPRATAGAVLTALALIACSNAPTVAPSAPRTASPPSATSGSTAVGTVADGASGISFIRPAAWARGVPNAHDPITDGPLVYLSTDPLLAGCAVAPDEPPHPPDARGRACDWPIASLAPNGVLITWLTTRILQTLPTSGSTVDVNATSAHLQVTRPGGCAAVGADETLDVLVPIGQPGRVSNIAMVACLRGPSLEPGEAQVRAMLASARIRP